MSTESTATTPLPYRFVRPLVSITSSSMRPNLGTAVRGVVVARVDLLGPPAGGGPTRVVPRDEGGRRASGSSEHRSYRTAATPSGQRTVQGGSPAPAPIVAT